MKPLIKYRFKSIFPALIVGTLVLIASIVLIFLDFRMANSSPFAIVTGTFYLERISINLFFLPYLLIALSIWMGMVLTKDYGSKERENFLAALPYKKSTRFVLDIMPGVVYYLVLGIFLSAAVCISYSISYDYFNEMNMMSPYYDEIMGIDTIGNALMCIWHIVLGALMVFLCTVFAGVISRNKMVTVFIVLSFCLLPVFVPAIKYGRLSDLLEGYDTYDIGDSFFVVYSNLLGKIIVMMVLSIVFAVLSYVTAVMIKRESGKLIVNEICERIFIVMAGLYGAVIISYVMNTEEMGWGIIIVAMVLTFAIIVYGLNKLVAGKGKYNFLNSVLIVMLLLSGCGKMELPKDIQEPISVYRGTKEVMKLREIFAQTSVSEYIDEQEDLEKEFERISISPEKITEKYAMENNRELVEITKEEWKEFYIKGIEGQDKYRYVVDDEIIYLETSDGKIVKNRAYLLMSRCEDLKNLLVETDNECVYAVFEELDNSILKQVENKSTAYPAASSEAFNCFTLQGCEGLRIMNNPEWTFEEADYLKNLQKMDGFSIACGACNDSVDSLSLYYRGELDDEQIDLWPVSCVRLDMFGKDGNLNEIKLIAFKNLEKIPYQCEPTIKNCLSNMGYSESDILEFLEVIPDEDGSVGDITFSVDTLQGKYKSIKIYSE